MVYFGRWLKCGGQLPGAQRRQAGAMVDATGVVVAASSAVAVLWQVITGNVPQLFDGRLWLVAQGRWAADSALAGAPSTEGTGAKWDANISSEAAGEHRQQRGVGGVVDGGYGRRGVRAPA